MSECWPFLAFPNIALESQADSTTTTGGRFPSDLNVNRGLEAPQSPSSDSSDRDTIQPSAAALAVAPVAHTAAHNRGDEDPYRLRGIASHSPAPAPAVTPAAAAAATYDDDQARYMASPQPFQAQAPAQPQQETAPNQSFFLPGQQHLQQQQPAQPRQDRSFDGLRDHERVNSTYGDWMAPAAIGAGAGVAGTAAYNHYSKDNEPSLQEQAAREAELVDDGGAPNTSRYQPNANEPSLQQQAAREAQTIDDGGAPDTSRYQPNTNEPILQQQAATESQLIADQGAQAQRNRGLDAAPTNNILDNGPTNSTFLSYPSNAGPGSGVAGSSDLSAAPLDGGLGGLEARGAHETGHIFPSVVRHNTDISVSQLHVPGSFPKRS